jgi:hypothetical protein
VTVNGNRTSLASLLALALVGFLMVGFAWYTHESDVQAHRSLIAGCERGNLLRSDVASVVTGLRQVLTFTATSIDASVARGEVPPARAARARASAAKYQAIADGLRAQPQVDCAKAFPGP